MDFEDYLRRIIDPLLEEPRSLKITISQDDLGTLLTLDIAQQDMGIVIGRMGENIKAIRTIMRHLGGKYQSRIAVKVNEPPTRRDLDAIISSLKD